MSEPKGARGMREEEVLARTLWAEARGGGVEGMEDVAQVILNRARHPRWWGNDLRSVCLARAQFSPWLASDPQHRRMLAVQPDNSTDGRLYVAALDVARRAIQGRLGGDRTRGADHYYAPAGMPHGRAPRWADPAKRTYAAHGHVFFRLEIPAPVEAEPQTPRTYATVSVTAAAGAAATAAQGLAGLEWPVAVALIVVVAAGVLAWRWVEARREREAAS